MIKTFKIMLCPSDKQITKLFQCAGVARFAYNWALDYEKKNHEAGNKFVSDCGLRKIFTVLKKSEEYKWLNDYSNNITKQAIKDSVKAFMNFFRGLAEFPRFKSRHKSRPGFYADTSKIKFTATHVILEKLTISKKAKKNKNSML